MLKRLSENLSNGFQDFPGFSITGSVPVKEELINGLIAELLQQMAAGTSTKSVAGESGPQFSKQQFAGLLKKCVVHAEAGVLTVNFEIRR
jgi:hypothetical protein